MASVRIKQEPSALDNYSASDQYMNPERVAYLKAPEIPVSDDAMTDAGSLTAQVGGRCQWAGKRTDTHPHGAKQNDILCKKHRKMVDAGKTVPLPPLPGQSLKKVKAGKVTKPQAAPKVAKAKAAPKAPKADANLPPWTAKKLHALRNGGMSKENRPPADPQAEATLHRYPLRSATTLMKPVQQPEAARGRSAAPSPSIHPLPSPPAEKPAKQPSSSDPDGIVCDRVWQEASAMVLKVFKEKRKLFESTDCIAAWDVVGHYLELVDQGTVEAMFMTAVCMRVAKKLGVYYEAEEMRLREEDEREDQRREEEYQREQAYWEATARELAVD